MSDSRLFEQPWIEKYRPERLSDVVGNEAIVAQLRTIGESGNIPNLILSGPPGTGKTTSVLALARELLGSNLKAAVLELNASDERGIDVVRDKIKSFALQKLNLPDARHKIVILDEADSMTEQAQQALRVIISDFSATTRFAIACNDSTKIIEPIQSRCCVLRFSKLKPEEIKKRLLKIVDIEHIELDGNQRGLNDIIDACDGDMRYALNNLQSTYIGFGKITHENVYKIIDIPKPEELNNIINDCAIGNLTDALNKLDVLYGNGYNSLDIINVCGKVIRNRENILSKTKFNLLKLVSEYKLRILDGMISFGQMYAFLSEVIKEFNIDKQQNSNTPMEIDG